MKSAKLYPIFLLLAVAIVSCKKDQEALNTIETQAKENSLEIETNNYFPIDTTNIWVFRSIHTIYNDVIINDSLPSSVTDTLYDTIKASHEIRIGNYMVKKWYHSYFNTQNDKILLILDTTSFYHNSIRAVNFLFTNKSDTTWTDTIISKHGDIFVVGFEQKRKNPASDLELILTVKQSFAVGLMDSYIIKKDTGISYMHANGANSDMEFKLNSFIKN